MIQIRAVKRVCPTCSEVIAGSVGDFISHRKSHPEKVSVSKKVIARRIKQKNEKVRILAKASKKAGRFKRLKEENARLRSLLLGQKEKVEKKESKLRKVSFYDSDSWRAVRMPVLRDHIKKHGRICLLCGCGGELHVDHIHPRSLRPDLELDPNNLQVLCRDCNLGKSNKDSTDFRGALSLFGTPPR